MKDSKLMEELGKRGYLHEIQANKIDFIGPVEVKNKSKNNVLVVVFDEVTETIH